MGIVVIQQFTTVPENKSENLCFQFGKCGKIGKQFVLISVGVKRGT